MTPTEVANVIEQAVVTIRSLPPVKLKQTFCIWPDYKLSFFDLIGNDEAYKTVRPKIKPNARQLKELDDVITWLSWLDKDVAKVIWARAEGLSWRKIAPMIGVSDKTCRVTAMAGILTIADKINRKGFKVVRFRKKLTA